MLQCQDILVSNCPCGELTLFILLVNDTEYHAECTDPVNKKKRTTKILVNRLGISNNRKLLIFELNTFHDRPVEIQ